MYVFFNLTDIFLECFPKKKGTILKPIRLLEGQSADCPTTMLNLPLCRHFSQTGVGLMLLSEGCFPTIQLRYRQCWNSRLHQWSITETFSDTMCRQIICCLRHRSSGTRICSKNSQPRLFVARPFPQTALANWSPSEHRLTVQNDSFHYIRHSDDKDCAEVSRRASCGSCRS